MTTLRMEYFDINANNVDSVTSIYVSDENKEKLDKVLASSFTKNLLELDLSGCKNLKGKLPVAKCNGLKKINIKDTQISNIDSLDKCTELEEAIVTISKKGMELKFSSDKLKSLELQIINEGSIDKVNNLPNLETLKIYSKYFVRRFLKFSKCLDYTNIKKLYLKNVFFNSKYLNQLQELTFLKLEDCYLIFDEDTTKIDLPSLKQIELHNIFNGTVGCHNFYDEIIFFELFINSNVTNLHISYDNITSNKINGIVNLENVEELHLINTKITDINILLKNKKLKTVYYKSKYAVSELRNLSDKKHFEVCYI
jgi:hypothetical protein